MIFRGWHLGKCRRMRVNKSIGLDPETLVYRRAGAVVGAPVEMLLRCVKNQIANPEAPTWLAVPHCWCCHFCICLSLCSQRAYYPGTLHTWGSPHSGKPCVYPSCPHLMGFYTGGKHSSVWARSLLICKRGSLDQENETLPSSMLKFPMLYFIHRVAQFCTVLA